MKVVKVSRAFDDKYFQPTSWAGPESGIEGFWFNLEEEDKSEPVPVVWLGDNHYQVFILHRLMHYTIQ